MEQRLLRAAEKGIGWLLAQSNPDGSYRDALPVLGAYYKTPYLWATAGRPGHFGRAIRYMQAAFHGPEGFGSETDPEVPILYSHFFNYLMGWVARGAWVGGSFEFARQARDYLAQPQGAYIMATCDQGPTVSIPTRSIGTAANAGVSFVYAGDLESARRCEEFVWNVLQQQDRADEFFLRTDGDGMLLREFPEQERSLTVIDLTAPDQMYWYLGIGMAMYGKLFEATGEQACLDRAAAMFDVFDRCRANVADDDLTVGKVAYATAVLFRLTGDRRYLADCEKCSENLIRTQQPEGCWLFGNCGDVGEMDRSTLLDLSTELTIWCLEIVKELAGR